MVPVTNIRYANALPLQPLHSTKYSAMDSGGKLSMTTCHGNDGNESKMMAMVAAGTLWVCMRVLGEGWTDLASL